jgi:hypothetical protein
VGVHRCQQKTPAAWRSLIVKTTHWQASGSGLCSNFHFLVVLSVFTGTRYEKTDTHQTVSQQNTTKNTNASRGLCKTKGSKHLFEQFETS